MNAILQQDMYINGRVNVFSNSTGDQIGYVTPDLKAVPIGKGRYGEFKNMDAAVKYILSVTEPEEKKQAQNTNQQSLF